MDDSAKQHADIAQAIREGKAKAPRLIRELKQQMCRERGGPVDYDDAIANEMQWFNKMLSCSHGIVELDGFTCRICGHVDDKEALDLLS